jgi:hypothetical protein
MQEPEINWETEQLRYKARKAGLIAGAVYRGDVWPTGTLVRMAGPKSKVTYRITGIRSEGERTTPPLNFTVQLTPLQPGPGRSIFWTDISYLRKVSE